MQICRQFASYFGTSLYKRRLVKITGFRNTHLAALLTVKIQKKSIARAQPNLLTTYSKLKFSKMSGKLEDVPDVEIDHGRFKYVLIKIYEKTPNNEEKSKYIVRGFASAAYHADVFEQVDKKLTEIGIEAECVGGGRILHDLDKKCLSVYGYSTGYGKADHEITTEILKKKFPDYSSISWSNEGY